MEVTPLIHTLTIQGQHLALLHPESTQGAQSGAATVADGLLAATLCAYCCGRQHSCLHPHNLVVEIQRQHGVPFWLLLYVFVLKKTLK